MCRKKIDFFKNQVCCFIPILNVDQHQPSLIWLGLAQQGPSQTTEIDADRHACFFSRFVIFFNRQSRIVSHMFALRFSAVLLGLEPPMFYLRKKTPSLTRRAMTVALSLKENGKKRQFYGPHARQEVASTIGCHQLAH